MVSIFEIELNYQKILYIVILKEISTMNLMQNKELRLKSKNKE